VSRVSEQSVGNRGSDRGSISRRRFVGLSLAGMAAAALPGIASAYDGYPIRETGLVSYDPRFDELFVERPLAAGAPAVPGPLIDRIASGFRRAEGPVWYENSILFVDPRLNSIFRIRDM
jgi:hypothetical protein